MGDTDRGPMVRDTVFFLDGADGMPLTDRAEPGVRCRDALDLAAGVPLASAEATGCFLPRLAELRFTAVLGVVGASTATRPAAFLSSDVGGDASTSNGGDGGSGVLASSAMALARGALLRCFAAPGSGVEYHGGKLSRAGGLSNGDSGKAGSAFAGVVASSWSSSPCQGPNGLPGASAAAALRWDARGGVLGDADGAGAADGSGLPAAAAATKGGAAAAATADAAPPPSPGASPLELISSRNSSTSLSGTLLYL